MSELPFEQRGREWPEGVFFDADTGGPLRLEFARIGVRRFRWLRRFGYRDHRYTAPFICPNDVEKIETDLASIPWFFAWIVPLRGRHFPAIMLHDALVRDEANGEPKSHLGPDVSREEADRIMRDAMGELGVTFLRRWLAWTGAFLATAAVAMQPRWWWRSLLVTTFGLITALGAVATLDIVDVVDWLPWMGDRSWQAELVGGAVAALVIPLLLSILWWRRWRAAAIGGVALAFVFHVTVGIFAAFGAYKLLEWGSRLIPGLNRAAPGTGTEAGPRVRVGPAAQVGKGASSFTDLQLDDHVLQMTISGPQMLVSKLELVTDLTLIEGLNHQGLSELAAGLQAVVHCGRTGTVEVPVTVEVDRLGPKLVIDVGPPSMYESILELSTGADGQTFAQLLGRTIAAGTGRGFLAGLIPLAATGHMEHHASAAGAATDVLVEEPTGKELTHGHS